MYRESGIIINDLDEFYIELFTKFKDFGNAISISVLEPCPKLDWC